MKKTYLIIASIAFIVLIVYQLLPDVLFEETLFPLEKEISILSYDDRMDEGTSQAKMDLSDSSLYFECELGRDTLKAAWCGLLLKFGLENQEKYRNWTFVDSIVLNIETHGIQEILIKIWAFDPDITDTKDRRSYRLLMKEVPLKEGLQKLSIPMKQFYTPNFWYENLNADKSLNQRHQEAIARIEIAPGWNQKRGEIFSIKLLKFSAVGVSNLYFGIVLGIFLILTIIAVGRSHNLKKDAEEK